MGSWALIIILSFTFTNREEPVRIESEQRYTAERCAELGQLIVSWLEQDGVKANWQCIMDRP